jgi:hypothetical protein
VGRITGRKPFLPLPLLPYHFPLTPYPFPAMTRSIRDHVLKLNSHSPLIGNLVATLVDKDPDKVRDKDPLSPVC